MTSASGPPPALAPAAPVSRHLASMRTWMIAEHVIGLVLCLLVASLGTAGFVFLGDVQREYAAHSLQPPPNLMAGTRNALASLMGFGFLMSLVWALLLLVSVRHTRNTLSKLFWFGLAALLSVLVGGATAGIAIYMFAREDGPAQCTTLAKLRREDASLCNSFFAVSAFAIAGFVVVPCAVYARRYVSYSVACGGTMPFHDATLEELANRAEARSLDHEAVIKSCTSVGGPVAGAPLQLVKTASSSTSSTSSLEAV